MKIIRPDYTNSILNVSNSFLKHYNIATKYPGIPLLDKELEKNYDHIFYILLDGMGVNVVNLHLDDNDGLKKYMKQSVTSVFPPTTVAATNAVLSGVPPISNGYLGWVQYFEEEDSDIAVFLNKDFYTDKAHKEIIRDKYLSYDNIVTRIHKHNPDVITNQFFPGYIEGSDTETFKDEIDKALVVAHNTDKSFSYLYWTQPDMSEHIEGTKSQVVKQVLKELNADYEELLENLPDNSMVVVIADHGLIDVEEINFFSYQKLVDMLIRKPSIEPRAINFFVKADKHDEFKEEFTKEFEGKYILLSKDDVFKSDIFGIGDKHPLIDMFLGDFLGIAVDKYMFALTDQKIYKAHHAGTSHEEMMVPLVIYTK